MAEANQHGLFYRLSLSYDPDKVAEAGRFKTEWPHVAIGLGGLEQGFFTVEDVSTRTKFSLCGASNVAANPTRGEDVISFLDQAVWTARTQLS